RDFGDLMHVTVLMAVYNDAGTVEAAVESIRTQTYTNWDLLMVDDGSTDDTPAILQRLAQQDERITVLRNETNRGLPAALNIGWRQARGELIARMDADDLCLPERLQRQVEFMTAHPEVAVLGTGVEYMDEDGRTLGRGVRPEQHEELVQKILRESPFYHPSVMVRPTFYEALGGYDERIRRAEDRDLWLRGRRRFRYHNLREPLIRYRISGKPSWRDIYDGTYALLLAVRREQMPLVCYWYPLRQLLGGVSIWTGLRRKRLF
ncbi:MAG: glycosyltransferase, partial [Planctomycetota bacterium]